MQTMVRTIQRCLVHLFLFGVLFWVCAVVFFLVIICQTPMIP